MPPNGPEGVAAGEEEKQRTATAEGARQTATVGDGKQQWRQRRQRRRTSSRWQQRQPQRQTNERAEQQKRVSSALPVVLVAALSCARHSRAHAMAIACDRCVPLATRRSSALFARSLTAAACYHGPACLFACWLRTGAARRVSADSMLGRRRGLARGAMAERKKLSRVPARELA